MIQLLAVLSLTMALLSLRRLHIRRKEAEEAWRESEVRFRLFMDNSPVVATIKDEQGRILYVNQPLQRYSAAKLEQIVGTRSADWVSSDVAQKIREAERAVLRQGPTSEVLEDVSAPDGTTHSWIVMRFPFWERPGRRLIGSVSVDITEEVSLKRRLAEQLRLAEHLNEELAKANARLNELATTDGLTGLTNYRRFRELLEIQFSYAQRHGKPLSLLLMDVDSFKQFNDSFGHQEGDNALISVATTLRTVARSYDVVARYGGEEFAVLLPAADSAASSLVGNRLRAAVEQCPWPLRPITVSIGVATMSENTRDFKHLLEQADEALYLAKSRGRNRVIVMGDLGPQLVELTAAQV